jgi:hypothetical protein
MKYVLVLVATMVFFNANAQLSGNEAIGYKLDQFISLTNKKQYSEAFDLMYPKLFTKVNKQELIDLMQSMENEGLALSISNKHVTSYSAPIVEGDETFVRMDYTADVQIDIKEGGMFDGYKPAQAMFQQFKATYGEENVTMSENNRTFHIKADKAMIAVQPKGGEWYLVEINPEQMELMESLFSPNVIATLVNTK